MTNASTPLPRRVEDDEPVVPVPHEELPDRLDRPLEVPEADAIESELDVPIDDDER